jgi:anti-sigma B factor antagonist
MYTHEKFTTGHGASPCTLEFNESQLAVRGELDMSNEDELEAAFETARRLYGLTVVDMSGVSFIDSSALRAFVRFHSGGNDLIVRDPSPPVARLLELTMLDQLLTIEPTKPR